MDHGKHVCRISGALTAEVAEDAKVYDNGHAMTDRIRGHFEAIPEHRHHRRTPATR